MDGICILCINIQGLINNYNELKYVIRKRKPDICICDETHLTNEILNSEIKINGYTILRTDSHSTRTGGVCVFIKDGLRTSNFMADSTDFIWLKSFDLYINKTYTVKIVAVYMSATANKTDILDYFENWCERNYINGNILFFVVTSTLIC